MLIVSFTHKFGKQYKKLERKLAEEVLLKTELFKDPTNHLNLKVHKLHGKFSNCFSFSVNYKTRIVFQYLSKREVAFLTMGDHSLYR